MESSQLQFGQELVPNYPMAIEDQPLPQADQHYEGTNFQEDEFLNFDQFSQQKTAESHPNSSESCSSHRTHNHLKQQWELSSNSSNFYQSNQQQTAESPPNSSESCSSHHKHEDKSAGSVSMDENTNHLQNLQNNKKEKKYIHNPICQSLFRHLAKTDLLKTYQDKCYNFKDFLGYLHENRKEISFEKIEQEVIKIQLVRTKKGNVKNPKEYLNMYAPLLTSMKNALKDNYEYISLHKFLKKKK